jgi:FkbM family methyltransferase
LRIWPKAHREPPFALSLITGWIVELQSNIGAHFTKWVVREGLLLKPFVLIDVGVQGGESERWHALGDHLLLHGFDAIEEVIEELKKQNLAHRNKHYHWIAAGKFDGEQTLYFDAENPFSSSFYQQAETTAQPREVQVRRLDTLMAEGVIPPADFLKADVEGYEKDVFLGAVELLKGLLGFETETAFTVSVEYPNTHFGTVLDIALKNHQRAFDIEFNRVPRASFQRALERENRPPIADHVTIGRPATVNVLFCRNLTEEIDSPANYLSAPPPLDNDRIIKQIIIYELYGLNDVAVDTVERLADQIAGRIDVDKAVRLLADPGCRTPQTFTTRVRELQSELDAHRHAHVEVVRELQSELDAHRHAHVEVVRELQSELDAHRHAHVEAVTEERRVRAAERDAFVARITELSRQVERLEGYVGKFHATHLVRCIRWLRASTRALTVLISKREP